MWWTELGLLQRRGEEYRGPVEWYPVSSIECEVWHARNKADGRSITTTIQLYTADLETLRRYLDVLVNLMSCSTDRTTIHSRLKLTLRPALHY